jgi:hypothetical protein
VKRLSVIIYFYIELVSLFFFIIFFLKKVIEL